MSIFDFEAKKEGVTDRLNYLRMCDEENLFYTEFENLSIIIAFGLKSLQSCDDIDKKLDEINSVLGDPLSKYDPFSDDNDELKRAIQLSIMARSIEVDTFLEVDIENDQVKTIDHDLVNNKSIIPKRHVSFNDSQTDLFSSTISTNSFTHIFNSTKLELLDFMNMVEKLFHPNRDSRIKWEFLINRAIESDLDKLYNEFNCNIINHDLNECLDEGFIKYTILKDNNILLICEMCEFYEDGLVCRWITEINDKIDELVYSTLIKLTVLYIIGKHYVENYTGDNTIYSIKCISFIGEIYEIICGTAGYDIKNLFRHLLENSNTLVPR
jgi:hypothetical protein